MRLVVLVIFKIIISSFMFLDKAFSQEKSDSCRFVFNFINKEFDVLNPIYICVDSSEIPFQYESEINMPVCDDTLCANVVLKLYWDLAGNYIKFDTIPGKPLTKFDHKKFNTADYQKLNQILKNRNSVLRNLKKEELVDKSVKIKAVTVDAVTGATPQTIKNTVVDGAVYSSFTLWNFVNGPIMESITAYTQSIYSEPIARQMLLSDNHETQLFALRKWREKDYKIQSDLLFQVIRQSVPLIRAYTINKVPLPFKETEKNRQFIELIPSLDDYSISVFLARINSEESIAKSLLPMVLEIVRKFNDKQQELIFSSCKKFQIIEFQKLIKKKK